MFNEICVLRISRCFCADDDRQCSQRNAGVYQLAAVSKAKVSDFFTACQFAVALSVFPTLPVWEGLCVLDMTTNMCHKQIKLILINQDFEDWNFYETV